MASSDLQDQFSPASPSSPATTPAASARSNALSARIASILSASYADLGIRDALETLDARKIQNTPETRRQLRLDVQRDVIRANGEIVHDFGRVAERLKRVGATIDGLNKCCADLRTRVSAANAETAVFLEETDTLLEQKSQNETRQRLLQAFNAHFLVSDDEAVTLTSSAEPVDDAFFTVLAKVKRIHQDSQILLGVSEHQRLGLEVLESSSRQLNSAFQKLYRWIQREFRSTLDLENPQISAAIRRALRVLAERPTLFQSCLDFFAEAREENLSDAFHAALTASSASDDLQQTSRLPATKPIEFQAHDPLRYVGDMLAWAHSATVSEREALEVLFIAEGDEIAKGIQAGIDSEPWSRPAVDANGGGGENGEQAPFDGRKALNELVSRDLAGVMRQIRQRTEQVVQSHDDATLAYKIANLLTFYHSTFQKLLGSESPVLTSLDTLSSTARRQFRSTTRDIVTQIQSDLTAAPEALPDSAPAPPEFLMDALETLTALLRSYDTSLPATTANVKGEEDPDSEGFTPVLAEALDPYIAACDELSRRLPGPRASHIFGLNCLLAARSTLAAYPSVTVSRAKSITESISHRTEALISFAYDCLLQASGILPLVQGMRTIEAENGTQEEGDHGESEDVDDDAASQREKARATSQLAVFQPDNLSRTAATLDDFLPEALMDAAGLVRELQDAGIAQEIVNGAAERFCADFERIEERIILVDEMTDEEEKDAEGTRPTLREVFPRTSSEIRVLLS